jgi:ABC-type hemin transport system substrate-binding protein
LAISFFFSLSLNTWANTCLRVASFAPSITQVLEELELERNIIAVSDYEDGLTYAKLARLGGYFNPNKELLFALHADAFIFLQEQSALAYWLQEKGKRVLVVSHDDLPGISQSLLQVGEFCGRGEFAHERQEKFEKSWHDLEKFQEEYAGTSMLMLVLDSDAQSFGEAFTVMTKNTVYGEMLIKMGFYVLPEKTLSALRLNPEALISLQPDVVLVLNYAESKAAAKKRVLEIEELLRQGKRKTVFLELQDKTLSIPGPRILEFASALHEKMKEVSHAK